MVNKLPFSSIQKSIGLKNSSGSDLPHLFINGNISSVSSWDIGVDENLIFYLHHRTTVQKSSKIPNFIFRSFRIRTEILLIKMNKIFIWHLYLNIIHSAILLHRKSIKLIVLRKGFVYHLFFKSSLVCKAKLQLSRVP